MTDKNGTDKNGHIHAEREIDPHKELDFDHAPLFRKTATLPADHVLDVTEEHEVITRFEDSDHEETRNIAHVGDKEIIGPRGEHYVLSADKFEKMYEVDPKHPDTYISTNVVHGVLLTEDVCFKAPWGETMHMKAGSTCVESILDKSDTYGIEEAAFMVTYGRADKNKEVFVSMDASTAEQRAAAAERGETTHLRDIEERQHFHITRQGDHHHKHLANYDHRDKDKDDDSGMDR